MRNRRSHVATRLSSSERARKLRAHEAVAELARAKKVFLQSDKASGQHLNDDKSPLIDLLTCIVCKRTMKLEKSAPDAEGRDIIQYRCELCDRIERVRLFRRTRAEGEG